MRNTQLNNDDLLFYQGSLTRALEKLCGDEFRHILHSETRQCPLPEERRLLKIRDGQYALIREIYLQCRKQRLVYGRTIVPLQALTGKDRQLAHWGNRSIGDFLFREPHVRRGEINIFRVGPKQKYFQLAGDGISVKEKFLWGRRSFFYLQYKPILVVEIFLPDYCTCLNSRKT